MSCGLHDVVALEGRGIPAALVATEVFRAAAAEQAAVLGAPDTTPIEVPHPVQPLARETIAAWAEQVTVSAVGRLTTP